VSDAGRIVSVGAVQIANSLPFVLIAGPCQLENVGMALEIAEDLSNICKQNDIGFIFKGSFDKANRTAYDANRGPGLELGLEILATVREKIGCPVTTDVHLPAQCMPVAAVVDLLQIPALLCRQTDLLQAAGATGRPVTIKKGQFLAPWDIENAAHKVTGAGNGGVILCERGTSFGYNTVISDMRALGYMAATGWPVMFDASHTVQAPGAAGSSSGGDRRFTPLMARAAVGAGVAALFIETHPDPQSAPSDGASMTPLSQMPELVSTLRAIDDIAKSTPMFPNGVFPLAGTPSRN